MRWLLRGYVEVQKGEPGLLEHRLDMVVVLGDDRLIQEEGAYFTECRAVNLHNQRAREDDGRHGAYGRTLTFESLNQSGQGQSAESVLIDDGYIDDHERAAVRASREFLEGQGWRADSYYLEWVFETGVKSVRDQVRLIVKRGVDEVGKLFGANDDDFVVVGTARQANMWPNSYGL